jgi:hypothetical protein
MDQPKKAKTNDMWQPLVLPRHHVDVSMTYVTSCLCHVHCMDVDVICIDVDVSSTDVDSSPADWARLTKF